MRAAPLEGCRARAREVFLPGLRGHHRAAGALASDRARARGAEPARHDPGFQVFAAPAAEPAERDLCTRRRGNRRLDSRGLGWRKRRDPRSDRSGDPDPCVQGGAHPCRRHDRAGADETEDDHRPDMDLCPRRPAIWRQGSAGGDLLLLAHARWRISSRASRRVAGIMQADAYAGYNELHEARRRPAPIQEAACWAHGRRKFFELAKLARAPIACEAVRRIDELFEIEREIIGRAPEQRLAVRQERSKPLVAALEAWLREQRDRISAKSEIAKAINYSLNRWAAFTRFLDDGRICLSNNAAERAVRGVAIGRGNWTFCGSDAGGHRAAAVYTLVETCKLNDVDPQAWLAYVLAKLPDHPAKRIDELLPWNWKASQQAIAEAA